MEALQLDQNKKTLSVASLEKPTATCDDDVIVRVAYGGVCGTDLKLIAGKLPTKSPITPGHEFAGVVVEVGKGVTHVKPGARVCIDPCRACRCCHHCVRGAINHCVIGGIKDLIGIARDGGWANYCKVPAEEVYVLPDCLTFQQGVLCEPLSSVYNGYAQLGTIPADSRILVHGAGIIGLLFACLFHHKGHRNVIISEPKDGRRKIATELGLQYDVVTPEELAAKFQGVNLDQKGLDIIVDCTNGDPSAITASHRWLRAKGKLCIFAVYPPDINMSLCLGEVIKKELTVVGAFLNPFTYARTIEMASAMAEKYLKYELLGVETFSIKDNKTALDSLEKGRISKAVFQLASDL